MWRYSLTYLIYGIGTSNESDPGMAIDRIAVYVSYQAISDSPVKPGIIHTEIHQGHACIPRRRRRSPWPNLACFKGRKMSSLLHVLCFFVHLSWVICFFVNVAKYSRNREHLGLSSDFALTQNNFHCLPSNVQSYLKCRVKTLWPFGTFGIHHSTGALDAMEPHKHFLVGGCC